MSLKNPQTKLIIGNLFVFALIAIFFYALFPGFRMQSHDGQNLYFLAEKIPQWQDSFISPFVFSPLQGSGTNFWPLNYYLNPIFWPFFLFSDPSIRVMLLSATASIIIFGASLVFYLFLSIKPIFAVKAAWVTTVLVMLQLVEFMTGVDPIIAIAYAYLALAFFMRIGQVDTAKSFFYAFLVFIFYTALSLAHPGWHLIGSPLLGFIVLAIILRSANKYEFIFKAGTTLFLFLVHLGFGTYIELMLMVKDTARLTLASEFVSYSQVPFLAGHLFRPSPTEIMWGIMLIIGILHGPLNDIAYPTKNLTTIRYITGLIYLCASIAGILFLYFINPWEFPKPSYVLLFVSPLAGLFTTIGINNIYSNWKLNIRNAITIVLVLIFLAWHLMQPTIFPNFYTLLLALFFLALLGKFFPRLSIFLALPIILISFYTNGSMLIGGGLDANRNGIQRMGLANTPVIDYLKKEISALPGQQFRGYVDDFYTQNINSYSLIDQVIRSWDSNWKTHGNGHKVFAWSEHNLPIISQYSPYIKPLYFAFFKHFLNRNEDLHTVNYLTITKTNEKILRLMGVRFLVSDSPNLHLDGANNVFGWNGFYIYEFSKPNLGNYSPIEIVDQRNFVSITSIMDAQGFNPEKVVIGSINGLTKAQLTKGELMSFTFDKGGFSIHAKSPDYSILVLPMQFSHCFYPFDSKFNNNFSLFRANIYQTGIFFEKEVKVKFKRKAWPFSSAQCEKLDLVDSYSILGLSH